MDKFKFNGTNVDSLDKTFVVAIGASAGGLVAIRELFEELPLHLNAPIVVAVHSNETSQLSTVLKFDSELNIKIAEHGEKLLAGWVYVAPGATHVFFKNGRIELSDIVENSGFRPSIDAMFMSLALEYRSKAIAVVLSGTMSDGMRGAQIIYDMGGQTIVQDPSDAQNEDMPKSIIRADHPKIIETASELGVWLKNKIETFELT